MSTTPAPMPATPAPTPTLPAPEEQVLPLPAAFPTVAFALDEMPAPALVIPKLNLNLVVVKVPAVGGQWDVSRLEQNVGWLETTGQKPGDSLAMAFVAHRTLSFGKMGPFAHVWKLRVNDEVIYRAEGTDYVYSVKYQFEVDPGETWRLYVKDKRQLLLVTCAEWDYAAWAYGKRLIVVTEEAGRRPAP